MPPPMTLVVQTAGGLLLKTTVASVALGTVPWFQLAAVAQAPPVVFVHVHTLCA